MLQSSFKTFQIALLITFFRFRRRKNVFRVISKEELRCENKEIEQQKSEDIAVLKFKLERLFF